MRWSALTGVNPADGDLVEVEGGFCVVREIVRVVRESKQWMHTAMTTVAFADTQCSSRNPVCLETWT